MDCGEEVRHRRRDAPPSEFVEGDRGKDAVLVDHEGTVLVQAERGPAGERETGFLVRRGRVLEIPKPWGALSCEYHGLTDRGWLIGRARLKDRPNSWRGFVAQPVR